ncbi:hypothetical protein HBH43_107530 [Parastagonospora nodorum]|nr:hypothetical protein HBH43_107530 [Parastagonospora nodorum]
MDRFCTICGFYSTVTVYDYIEKDKNADLAIADGISDAPDMCAKDDLVGRKGPPNYVDTFGSDFAFSFAVWLQRIKCTLRDVDSLFADIQEDIAKTSGLSGLEADQHFFVYQNILLLIAFIISHRLFADELLVYVTIGNLSCEARRRRSIPSTLLAGFIPTTKIRDPLLKTLENAAKSGILLACADGRIRQCYLTICAILADYEEQVLLTGVKKNRYCTRYTRCLDKGHDDFVYLVDCFGWKHYNFNIHVSLATDTLHLLLKGLLVAVVSLLFVSKAPFALHFIRAVCDLVTLAQYKNIRMYGALDGICTGANSEAYYITMVKQFYSMTNKKEYILQICLHNSWRTALLAADYATVVKQRIQPHSIKLPLSEVAVNIVISDFIHAAAVFDCLDVDLSWVGCMSRSSGKRHNDPEHCDEEVVRCAPNWQQIGLWRRDYVWVQEFEHGDNRRQSRMVTDDGKYMAYIGAFSEVLLFNNNGQIDNTTGMLSVRRRAWNAASKRRTLQAFKFYDLSTIIRLVHLVLRDLPDSITCTTMSYYVNNYIDWDEYNCLYSLTFDIDLLRTLREY